MHRREVRVDEALRPSRSQETGAGGGGGGGDRGVCLRGVSGRRGRWIGAPSGGSPVGVEGLVVGTGKGRAGHVWSTRTILVVMHGRGV